MAHLSIPLLLFDQCEQFISGYNELAVAHGWVALATVACNKKRCKKRSETWEREEKWAEIQEEAQKNEKKKGTNKWCIKYYLGLLYCSKNWNKNKIVFAIFNVHTYSRYGFDSNIEIITKLVPFSSWKMYEKEIETDTDSKRHMRTAWMHSGWAHQETARQRTKYKQQRNI